MRYGYTIPHKNVVLEGIPFKWNTNLPDEALLEIYEIIRKDPDILTPSIQTKIAGSLSISFHVFNKLIQFREGACHCIGAASTITDDTRGGFQRRLARLKKKSTIVA